MTSATRGPADASAGIAAEWRAVPLTGVTLVLLAVVAVASGGVDIGGVPREPGNAQAAPLSGGPSESLVLLAIAGLAGVTVLLAFAFLGASWSSGAGARVARGGTRVPRWVGAILLISIAGAPIAVASLADGRSGERETVSGTRRSAASVPSPRPDASTASTDGWSWTPVIVAVALSVAAVAAGVSLRRGDRRGTTARRARTRDAAEALDRTIDDLRADPDPRHAVIASYAWMEDELASSGRARRPSTAPFEYLDEALRELAIPPAPARSLTELFEVARFSRHRVDPSMKDGAIAALVEIRDALAGEPS